MTGLGKDSEENEALHGPLGWTMVVHRTGMWKLMLRDQAGKLEKFGLHAKINYFLKTVFVVPSIYSWTSFKQS